MLQGLVFVSFDLIMSKNFYRSDWLLRSFLERRQQLVIRHFSNREGPILLRNQCATPLIHPRKSPNDRAVQTQPLSYLNKYIKHFIHSHSPPSQRLQVIGGHDLRAPLQQEEWLLNTKKKPHYYERRKKNGKDLTEHLNQNFSDIKCQIINLKNEWLILRKKKSERERIGIVMAAIDLYKDREFQSCPDNRQLDKEHSLYRCSVLK